MTYSKPDLYYSHSLTWKGLQLHALSTDSFVVINLYGDVIDVRFQKEAGNDVVIESYLDSTPLPFTRQPKMEPRYADYRGVYRNASTGAVLRVKSRRQKLVARKGIIRIPLVPFNTDEFYAAELDGLFVFRRENGAVRTLKVNASDFRNFVFDRQK